MSGVDNGRGDALLFGRIDMTLSSHHGQQALPVLRHTHRQLHAFTRPRLDVCKQQDNTLVEQKAVGRSNRSCEEAVSKRSNSGRPSAPDVGRRNFLKGASATGAAALTAPAAANTAVLDFPQRRPKASAPGPKLAAADAMPPSADPVNQSSSGGDFMVGVLKSLDIDYLAINCASSFRGLHEAVINHGGNTQPEIITCPHEEIAVHMGQGYAKMEGKPLAMACHGVVGLQHAAMAMYNAWCDRVPVIVVGGNIMEANKRAPGIEWPHSAIDPAALTRDFVKWDDQPASLQHFAESAVRAYKIAMTPPMAPVMLSLDAELQENPIENRDQLRIPKLSSVVPPQGDDAALAQLAKMLVEAENPVIICDRVARTPAGAAAGGAGGNAAMCHDRQLRPDELPFATSAQSIVPPLHHFRGRPHRRNGAQRCLGHADRLPRSHRP